MIQCNCKMSVSWIQLLVNKNLYTIFLDLIVKNRRLTTSKSALHFGMKCSKSRRILGLRPIPRWGAYDAPQAHKSLWASCFWKSQLRAVGFSNFTDSHVYMSKTQQFSPSQCPPLVAYSASIFFTCNTCMSHRLKSLKICPAYSFCISPFICNTNGFL